MNHTAKFAIYPLIALTAILTPATGTTALIDFGRADAVAPSPYNSAVVLTGATGDVALIDTDTVTTGWTVSVTENGSGNGGSAGATADVSTFPVDIAGFDAAALGDSVFANQGNGGSDPSMVLLFSGLSSIRSYDLLLYGSRGNGQPADQRWSLTQGIGGDDVDQISGLNDSVYVDWTGVTPNASGEIEITINSPGPDMVGALALNFASITETSDVDLITSFTSAPETPPAENPAILSWEVVDSLDSLVLDDGNGNTTDLLPLTTAGTGSTTVSPAETTTYSLTAAQGENKVVQHLIVFSADALEITSFTASAGLIQTGSSVDLSWEVIGGTSLTLNPGGIDVMGTNTINLTPTETTSYTLILTNSVGFVSSTLEVEVLSGPIPSSRYLASGSDNTANSWQDVLGGRTWTMTGVTLNAPLTSLSPNTNITAAYTSAGGQTGGSTASFQHPEFTAEIWFRPGLLSADHQMIFETGGGQNGLSALITDSTLRLLGTTQDVRHLDVTISTLGLNLDDFLQLVITNNEGTDEYTASLRDTFGNVRTVNETADVSVGVNGAGLFVRASGALGGLTGNLGGSTDAAAAAPAGLTGFEGEIAILNIYDRILDTAEIQAAFERVATIGTRPAGLAVTQVSFDDAADELTATWNSINGQSYLVEFSTSLEGEWFELAGPFTADSDSTTETMSLPPNQPRFFVRVVVDTP